MKHDSDILKRIKNYFMRRRSAGEAHAFEREAERDPFLYEAMEGFEEMLSSDIQQAMDELDDMLDRRSKRKRGIVWWQAAGIALAVATGATLFVVMNDGGSSSVKEDVVMDEKEPASDQNYTPRTAQPEFEVWGDSIDAFAYEEDEKPIALEEEAAEGLDLQLEDANISVSPEEPISKSIREDRVLEKEEPKTYTWSENETQERLKEELSSGFKSEDNIAGNADVALSEEDLDEPQSAESNQTVSPAVVLDQESAVASETAPRYTTGRAEPVDERKSARAKTATNTPKNGRAAYRTYLRDNLNASDDMPQGTVILTFEFDRDGKPKKIQVSKSLCTACDAEAIRLIQNGPAWNVENRKQRATIEVVFP